jgi:hypothetical protein
VVSGGTGKAEAAKLQGAGIGPKPCPGKCAAEKGRLIPTEREFVRDPELRSHAAMLQKEAGPIRFVAPALAR